MIDKVGSGFKDYAPFILRVGLSTIFIVQGAREITDHGTNLRHLLPAAVQLLGGLFILIGFLTRWAAAAVGALAFWQIIQGPQLGAITRWSDQIYLANLTMSFALFGLGGGKWSVDEANKNKKKDH